MWRKEAEVIGLIEFSDYYCLKLKEEAGFIIERTYLNGAEIKEGDQVQINYEKGEIIGVKVNGIEYDYPSKQEQSLKKESEKIYKELPPILQSKMDELRARNDKNITSREHLFLEAFTFGAQIAEKFKTIQEVRKFHSMEREKQKKIFPFLTFVTEKNYITASCYAALFVIKDNMLKRKKSPSQKDLSL